MNCKVPESLCILRKESKELFKPEGACCKRVRQSGIGALSERISKRRGQGGTGWEPIVQKADQWQCQTIITCHLCKARRLCCPRAVIVRLRPLQGLSPKAFLTTSLREASFSWRISTHLDYCPRLLVI